MSSTTRRLNRSAGRGICCCCFHEQPLAVCDGLEGRQLYRAWLGCSQAQDAAQCLHSLVEARIKNVSWLVVDHYGLDATWEKELHLA